MTDDEREASITARYVKQLEEIATWSDTHLKHIKSDEALVNILYELGYDEIIKAYQSVEKWFN